MTEACQTKEDPTEQEDVNKEPESDSRIFTGIIGHISMFKLTGVVINQTSDSLDVSSNFDTFNTIKFPKGTLKQPVSGCRIAVTGEIYGNVLQATRMALFEPNGEPLVIKVE